MSQQDFSMACVTIRDNSTGKNVVKNVKIDEEAHKKLRIRAAQMECNIGDLCSILIRFSLEKTSDEELKRLLLNYPNSEQKAP